MPSEFKTVALIGRYNTPEIAEPVLRLAAFLEQQGYKIVIPVQTGERIGNPPYTMATLHEIGEMADVAVVLGGDGTLLNVARSMINFHVPLIGVNQGRLGFLTDVSRDNMLDTISVMLQGEYTAEDRILLHTEVIGNHEKLFESCAFNDVVISKGSTGRIIEIETFIDGEFVNSQRSDGLVVATPTGSTAYALSAGGPILHPTLEAIALVPICPHTLGARPIAVNSHSRVEIRVVKADDCQVHFDGQRRFDLNMDDTVIIERAKNPVRLLHPFGYSYYHMLRQKLHWGEKL